MSTEEFKEENEQEHRGASKSKKDLTPLKFDVEKLRNKFKWMKDQWRKYTDRVKNGSGKVMCCQQNLSIQRQIAT